MIQVTKASGQLEAFSADKVRESLRRAGIKEPVIDQVLLAVKPKLYDKIPTGEVYRLVYGELSQHNHDYFHYGIKSAIMALGPSGYPFEKFVAKLFTLMGYTAKVQVMLAGQCVEHEVDVVIGQGGVSQLIECKFHQHPGTKTDVKDALYIQARFEDIAKKSPGVYQKIWLVTNTKLTSQAIAYGQCQGMGLMAWRYPQSGSLEELVEKYQAHPLTCLNFLTDREKQLFRSHELVLCREIKVMTDKQLNELGLADNTIKAIRSALA